jgi:hypothetical protein
MCVVLILSGSKPFTANSDFNITKFLSKSYIFSTHLPIVVGVPNVG